MFFVNCAVTTIRVAFERCKNDTKRFGSNKTSSGIICIVTPFNGARIASQMKKILVATTESLS